MKDSIRPIIWSENTLRLLDQRRLPHETVYLDLKDVSSVAAAITDMVVRGAPAIGITAAYGVVLAANIRYRESPADWKQTILADLDRLAGSRPTAVNLSWAIARMRVCFDSIGGDPSPILLEEAKAIHRQDIADNKQMGELGATLIESPCGVLTHCNAGALATGGYGSALGVIRSAFALNKITQVYADETRPWLQGSRLTAWELLEDGIPVTLLCDGAAAQLMKVGEVQWVIVGSDRIAANGDVANKIGTYSVAVAAQYHGVKFMVVAPTSTVDMSISHGNQIPIESRDQTELLALAGKPIAASGAHAWNPVFDVTPAALVDVLVTEKGIVHSPTTEKIAAMMKNDA